MDVDGKLVVAWDDDSAYDGAEFGVFAAGASTRPGWPVGKLQFRVNTRLRRPPTQPAVAAHAKSSFIIVWQSPRERKARAASSASSTVPPGLRFGGEFQVNTYTTFDRRVHRRLPRPPDRDLVVAWHWARTRGSYGILRPSGR